MTPDQKAVLDALYLIEGAAMQAHNFDGRVTPNEVASALPNEHPLHGDAAGVRRVLEELWSARRVLQIPAQAAAGELVDVIVPGLDAIGETPSRLPVEQNDVRGFDGHPWTRVAIFGSDVPVSYRSRVTEIARLLSRNQQRFRMLPSTGLLRYERRPQLRPAYSVDLSSLQGELTSNLSAGYFQLPTAAGTTERYALDPTVRVADLRRSIEAALDTLKSSLETRNQPPRIAAFQAQSLRAMLAGLYSGEFRRGRDGHIVTAGVGSGKSYAFQLGALVHAAYSTLGGKTGVSTLLVYPRVVLAANQFQDLQRLVEGTSQRLGQLIAAPVLDAGGRLGEQQAGAAPVRGQRYHSIRAVYQNSTPILITNLDTLANRIAHPEASAGLTAGLDLIVLDEVHLLSGLYGAHGRMLLKRVSLLRTLWRLRRRYPNQPLEFLLQQVPAADRPYVVGASATIAEPRHHLGRVIDSTPERVVHIGVEDAEETGWVHHLFLRQRPEASSMTAAINAASCLIHNRRDGLFHEYYERTGGSAPLRLDELSNPVLPSPTATPRDPKDIHKTLGFCDSLDGVNRWADLVADNERTKAQSMSVSASPVGSAPYFALFAEPLWRVVLHGNMSQSPPRWRDEAIRHYGSLCRDCKRGVKRTVARVPPGLSRAQSDKVDKLWDNGNPNEDESYLAELGVRPDDRGARDFLPVLNASRADTISNLDGCGFFQAGLCWWWSLDHLGSNHPRPVSGATPINGYRKARQTQTGYYHPVSGIRVRSFTSKANLSSDSESINDIFQAPASAVLRHSEFGRDPENCSLIIGSPSLEVGVDLTRVRDGITFRAMRDPASLQQKVGRVGREMSSDSLLVHLVTENARDHFYFRNPRVALNPEYLQPIPLHEDNRIVARNHFFMGIFDFLPLLGAGPIGDRPGHDGDRLMLVNDHKNQPSFRGWDRKVETIYDFFFGAHPRAATNRANLASYLRLLGAEAEDVESAAFADPGPHGTPCAGTAGALDVFRHEIGPNFFLTPLSVAGSAVTLAKLAAWDFPPRSTVLTGFARHAEFLRTYHNPTEGALKTRSYARDLFTLPLFRRGVPASGLPGNQPYLWTPNFFESVGREYVRVFLDRNGRQTELGYEPLATVLALLLPGTVTYRYDTSPSKVPVRQFGAVGLDTRQRGLEDVVLDVADDTFYEPVSGCPPIAPDDLPSDFPDRHQAVPVFRPRQVGMIPSWSEPLPHPDGLLADDDERPSANAPLPPMATPPRCFGLRWYRIEHSQSGRGPIADRLTTRYTGPDGAPVPSAPRPPVLRLFSNTEYDAAIEVTAFVWGLDRQFMTRQVDAARLVYRNGDANAPGPVALGYHFTTPGLRFEIDLRDNTVIGGFLRELESRPGSPAHQAVLAHALHDFLAENARAPADPNNPPWAEQARPSVFVVRNLRTIVWFHLLEQWHPAAASRTIPQGPPRFSLDDIIGCFSPGHARYLDPNRYARICRWIAAVQNPASVNDRAVTLQDTRTYFDEACARAANLNTAFFRLTAERLLLNSTGIALHNAALRVSGASAEDVSYFYRRRDDAPSEIVLFDSDEFGNGTCDLLRRNFHVSAIERVLAARETALGGNPDPLPTTDFVECIEDAMQECGSSQASHLAFHATNSGSAGCWRELDGASRGERLIGGPLFDFLRTGLGLGSFDDALLFQWVPEFLAHISQYPAHAAHPLFGSGAYPTFQALESAFGFCVDGCVACLVAPEQNLHGVLSAKESVSRLLLDSLYREVVCESPDSVARLTYPGTDPGRTVDWSQLAAVVATSLGRTPGGVSSFTVTLQTPNGPSDVTVFPATTPGAWTPVMRPTWDAAPPPGQRVRPRMPL